MKNFTALFLGLAALTVAPHMMAQDVYLASDGKNPSCKILRGGEYDILNGFVKNTAPGTATGTLLELGEVDFGDGNKYNATCVDFANGWYTDGWAILWAGSDWDDAVPFTQMDVNEYRSYYSVRRFGANMAYDVFEGGVSPNIYLMEQPIQYSKPTGKQKVYLTFEGGNGNVFGVGFYEKAFTEEDFVGEDGGWDGYGGDTGIRLRWPLEDPRYDDKSIVLEPEDLTPLVATGEDTDFVETKIDYGSEENPKHHWGWTADKLLLGADVDFGSNRFQQVVLYVSHWSANLSDYLNVYIDDNTEANQIGRVWVGRELRDAYYPMAINLTKEVSGTHKLIVEWETPGSQCDLRLVGLYEGTPWPAASKCGVELVDDLPIEGAFHFTYVGTPEGQGDPWAYEIKARGQWEAAGNIGYTGPGTVISFYMPDGSPIDFGDSEEDAFTHVVVNHSAESSWAGDIDVANFKFYLDLDPNYNIPVDEWTGNLDGILEGHDPVAIVRLQGTGNWATKKHVRGEFLEKVTGLHDLYMVYSSPEENIGANVFDIYFEVNKNTTDDPEEAGVKVVNKDGSDVKVYTSGKNIVVETKDSCKVAVYALNGVSLVNDALQAAGTYTLPVNPGIYVVKTVDANGKTAVAKVIVR